MTNALNMSTQFWNVYYHPALACENDLLPDDSCGKWMCFFYEDERSPLEELCSAAIENGIAYEAKMSTPLQMILHGERTGIACFYIDGSKEEQHKNLISFMLANNLFPRDENGKLIDAAFKFDWQTAEGQYGEKFIPKIKLSDFLDLNQENLL